MTGRGFTQRRNDATRVPLMGPDAGVGRVVGFVLLEVLLALTLFGLVAVALTSALSQVGKLAVEGQIELHVINGLQSALLEASKVPEMEPGSFRSDPDILGIVYETTIEEMELFNIDEQPLTDIYRVEVRALWEVNGLPQEEIAETFRYEPLYRQ